MLWFIHITALEELIKAEFWTTVQALQIVFKVKIVLKIKIVFPLRYSTDNQQNQCPFTCQLLSVRLYWSHL